MTMAVKQILLILLLSLTSSSSSSLGLRLELGQPLDVVEALSKEKNSQNSFEKVSLDLYYESLCPYCTNFIVNYLSKIFENGLIDIVNLKLIPYGNARIKPDGSIVCQHGPLECKFNLIETCAINIRPAVEEHFPFILCVESLVMEKTTELWPSCAEKNGLSFETLLDCYNSTLGMSLELEFAAETDSLVPPHKYVPWVVVNGQPLYDEYVSIEQYVCNGYEGPKPERCSQISGNLVLDAKKTSDGLFSVREDEISSV